MYSYKQMWKLCAHEIEKKIRCKKLKTWCKNNNEKFWFWIMVVSMNLKTQFWEKNNCVLIWYVCAHRREQEWSHTMREKMCVSESDNKFENKIKWWYITSDIFF